MGLKWGDPQKGLAQNTQLLWGWLPSSTLWLKAEARSYKRKEGGAEEAADIQPHQVCQDPQDESQDFQISSPKLVRQT